MNNLVFLQVMSLASVTRGLLTSHLHRYAPSSLLQAFAQSVNKREKAVKKG